MSNHCLGYDVESSSSDEDIDISALTREYNTVEEAQKLFTDSKSLLEKIKRKHRTEQQRHRRLLRAFKQIRTKFKTFEQEHPSIIVPPNLLVIFTFPSTK